MTPRTLAPRARPAPALLAAVLALASTVSACAQPGSGAQGRQGAAATPAQVDSILPRADRGRYKGSDSARVTIVEVSDFQCPFCRQWFDQTYAKLDSAYIRTGKVRMVFINYPLPNHTQAYPAAKAALCAGAQGKFWPMHDRLFSTQSQWSGQADAAQRFARFAVDVGLDAAAWRDCYENDRVAPVVINDVSGVSGAGIQGTPTFIVNGRDVLNGAVTFEEMSRSIEAQLSGAPGQAPAPAPAPPPAPPGS
jgi:protein-disulfide isomerase